MLNLFPQNTDSDAGTRPAPPRRGAGGYGIWSDRRAGGAGEKRRRFSRHLGGRRAQHDRYGVRACGYRQIHNS